MRAVRGEALAAAALGALAPGIVGAVNGGYFATAWGWIALVLLWVAGLAVALRSGPQLTRPELALSSWPWQGWLAWVFASLLWAPSADEPIREAERLLVYVSVILAAPLIVRKGRESWLLGGVLAGIAALCTYALAARLIPGAGVDEARAGERLAPTTLGYWNALGIFAVLGILVAAGIVGRSSSWWSRGLAGASLVVLSTTVYLTFSRGAWLALAVGLIAMLAFDPGPPANRRRCLRGRDRSGCRGLVERTVGTHGRRWSTVSYHCGRPRARLRLADARGLGRSIGHRGRPAGGEVAVESPREACGGDCAGDDRRTPGSRGVRDWEPGAFGA